MVGEKVTPWELFGTCGKAIGPEPGWKAGGEVGEYKRDVAAMALL